MVASVVYPGPEIHQPGPKARLVLGGECVWRSRVEPFALQGVRRAPSNAKNGGAPCLSGPTWGPWGYFLVCPGGPDVLWPGGPDEAAELLGGPPPGGAA